MLRNLVRKSVLMVAFFCVFCIIFTGLTAAESKSVHKVLFSPDRPVTGSLRIEFPDNRLKPLFAYAATADGRFPASAPVVTADAINLELPSDRGAVTGVVILAESGLPDPDFSRLRILSGGRALKGFFSWYDGLSLDVLNSVTDSLALAEVGASDTHKIGFTTSSLALSDSAIIWVTFPGGFDISAIGTAIYSDNDPANNGNEPQVASWDSVGQTVKFFLNSGAQPAVVGSRISVVFSPVTNDTAAGSFTVVALTTDSLGNIENGPDVSAPFNLNPSALDHIAISPSAPISIPADSSVLFDVSGADIYNNIIDTLTFAYALTVDSCGQVSDGIFTAIKVGACYLTASTGGITDSSGLITVVPGQIGRFGLSGYPESRTAGVGFINPINVKVYDVRENIKTDYLGEMWFTSSDTLATLPYNSVSRYTFTVGDQGQHNFAGSGFTLRTAGNMYIMATNGPVTDSTAFIRVNSAVIDTFLFSVVASQTAGYSFNLQVVSAYDQFNNPASGQVIVSFSGGTGGNSPDGIPPSLNNINVTSGNGSALQTLTNAVPTILEGSVSGAMSIGDTILVAPGNLGRFTLDGYPDSTTAGNVFPNPGIDATVFDIFGNLKTNFLDSVYFESSDTLAVVPYTGSGNSKYKFVSADSGSHIFPGAGFILKTSNEQDISITNGTIADTSNNIMVWPGPINSFILFAPIPPVTAGTPFQVTVNNCRDQWANPTGGTVTVTDSVGGGSSPNGTPPIFNSIRVVSGAGSAYQTLVNMVTTVLSGASGSIVRVTDSVYVLPGSSLGVLDLNITTPQVNATPFTGTADLTAYDTYGNLKTNFDASSDNITISSSAGGVMQNNLFDQAGDFVGGVVDLVARGTSFNGRGGVMTFSAASNSGVIGISDPVDMRAISCDSLLINEAIVSWGDTATGIAWVTNDGGAPVDITDIDVYTESGTTLNPVSITPALPHTLGPGLDNAYNIAIEIPIGFTPGIYPLTAAVAGAFGIYPVYDTLSGFADTLEIQQASNIGYVAGSLNRDTLSTGEWYSLSFRISNTGDAGFGVLDSSFIYFTDTVREFMAPISSGVYVPPNTPSGILAVMDSALVDPLFGEGIYQAQFIYYGRENGHFISGSFPLNDSIRIQASADISYITGSLNIASLVPGQNALFSIRVHNSGAASFIVDHQNTRFYFTDSVRDYIAYADTSSGNRVDMITSDTTIHFAQAVLHSQFSSGIYQPGINLRGTQNGIYKNLTLNSSPDSVLVSSRGTLRIDTTYIMTRNAPFANISQPCSLLVSVSNGGEEGIDNFAINLFTDGGSTVPAPFTVAHLNGLSSIDTIFQITSGAAPDSSEIFSSSISGGSGEIIGLPPPILPPLDNYALLVIETPAELALSPIDIVSPPEAMDDTVTIGQNLIISASAANLGQADITGVQSLTLDPGSTGFIINGPASQTFILDQDLFWNITAPPNPVSLAVLTIRFTSFPFDRNDGSSSVGADSVSTRTFEIDTSPAISQSPAVTAPAGAVDRLISTDQTFALTDTLDPLGIYSGLSALIELPAGFTTQDSLLKHPSGNIVRWTLRAPSVPMDDSVAVHSWLFDTNTGDSVGTAVDYIVLSTVRRADLNISSRIAGPQAALDGILEPSSELLFSARVDNNGTAAAGTGRLLLHLGSPDMISQEPLVRDFTPGVPVQWTITVPDTESVVPIPIWATIDSIPDDVNSNLPSFVSNDLSGVTVTVKELLPQMAVIPRAAYSGSVVKGQELVFLSFAIRDRDRGGSYSVGVLELSFGLHSSPVADIYSLFSSASLSWDASFVEAATGTPGLMSFVFPDTIVLGPGETIEFDLNITISDSAPAVDFSLALDGEDILGVAFDNGIPTAGLIGVSSTGDPLLWEGNPTVILDADFSSSVSSYPNPFNPDNEAAKIGYYLAAASDLEIRIFTLLGELVWTKSIGKSDALGGAGLHTGDSALLWYGKNDSGYEINSGVYICIIKNITTGEEERFKIAVVK